MSKWKTNIISQFYLLFFFSCCLAAFFFIICILLSADTILIFGVTTLDGEDDEELLEDILTGVVDPDIWEGDLDTDDDLFEKPAANPWDDKHDAHCQPEDMSLSLITGLWQSYK